MRIPFARSALIVAGLLALSSCVAAQEPAPAGNLTVLPSLRPLPGPSRVELAEPNVGPDRRGSPVETLERLTGERSAEPDRERDEIETDRDSFTPATTTVGRRRLVVESAYSFIDNRRIGETHSVPELLLRYGVTDRVELRLGWNYEVGGAGNAVTGADAADEESSPQSRLAREYTLSYGMKIGITRQDEWLPRIAFILQGFTPTGGSTGTSTATQLVATLAAGWNLPNRWRIDTAIRYGTESEEGDHFNQWAPSAVLRIPIGEKWAAHVEYFALFTTGKEQNTSQHFFSPGLHYLVTPDCEVGFRLGWGLNTESARFFANVGVGYRF